MDNKMYPRPEVSSSMPTDQHTPLPCSTVLIDMWMICAVLSSLIETHSWTKPFASKSRLKAGFHLFWTHPESTSVHSMWFLWQHKWRWHCYCKELESEVSHPSVNSLNRPILMLVFFPKYNAWLFKSCFATKHTLTVMFSVNICSSAPCFINVCS